MSELQAAIMRMVIRATLVFGLAWLALAYGIYDEWSWTKDPKYLGVILTAIGGGEGAAAATKYLTRERAE